MWILAYVLRQKSRYVKENTKALFILCVLLILLASIPIVSIMPIVLIAFSFFLASVLFSIAVVDALTFRIPDKLNLALGSGGIGFLIYWIPAALITHSIAACISIIAFRAVAWLGRLALRREALGGGDIKFVGGAALWLGPSLMPQAILIAALSALGSVVAARKSSCEPVGIDGVAFGPFLAFGVWISWLYGPMW